MLHVPTGIYKVKEERSHGPPVQCMTLIDKVKDERLTVIDKVMIVGTKVRLWMHDWLARFYLLIFKGTVVNSI